MSRECLCDIFQRKNYSKPLNCLLIGQAKFTDLRIREHYDAEFNKFKKGKVVYYYFPDDEEILESILEERVIGSYPRLMCIRCIKESLNSSEPHYGDGVYLTLNSSLNPHCNYDSIKRAHGIPPGRLYYRAIVKIFEVSSFLKFPRTGGIIKSCPETELNMGDLVKFNIEDAIVKRIERWDGNSWRVFR